jgi:hypothetical protein
MAGRLFKTIYTRVDPITGKRKRCKTAKWYARIGDRKVPLHQDRKIAEAMYQEKMRITSLGFDPNMFERTRKQPVLNLLTAFEESQRARGLSDGHVKDQLHKL